MDVFLDIGSVKGIGEKKKAIFNKCGIYTIMDLLLYFPRDYEKINCVTVDNFIIGAKNLIKLRVIDKHNDIRVNGKTITSITFIHGTTKIIGKWFNQPYMKNKFKIGYSYFLEGKLDNFKNKLFIINPTVVNESIEKCTVIKPKYNLKSGLTDNVFRKTILEVLDNISIKENLPQKLIDKYDLCTLNYAIRNIHNPKGEVDLKKSLERLKFQEMFTYCLKVNMLKDYLNNNNGISFPISPYLKDLKESLPFELTKAQKNVIKEVLINGKKNSPMNRLIQGDVGSGKTMIAIISMFNVVKNGYQAALMAPTEVLAQQHYDEVYKILNAFGVKIELLTSSISKKNKEDIKLRLKNGEIDIIVGTHALIQEDVEFKNIGLAITDEQHRFGVLQRNKLNSKGKNIDVLVMSATPIPRTLSLVMYGDLEVSIIDELPPGRQKIDTYSVNKEYRKRVYNFALKQINEGRQIYVVCPLVEENENMDISSIESIYEELSSIYFKKIPIGILHGKMNNKDKEKIMREFKDGLIKVLICTTVVEVGVNVPNATLMIIENAERYGLSQLHQLRGRVGRGKYKSYCILISDIKNNKTKKRMDIMKNSNDGFYIAEEDLKIRGSGEMFGFRQHGEDGFVLSDIFKDVDVLKKTFIEAKEFCKSSEYEDIKLKEEIMKKLDEHSRYICFN